MTDPAGPDSLRVGAPERAEAVRALNEHRAESRLRADEYDMRVALAHEAQTRGDLRELFADLPPPHPGFMSAPVPVVGEPAAGETIKIIYPGERPPLLSDKNRFIAGLLQIVLPIGAGRFYTRDTSLAVAQLITAFFVVGVIWCFIDGIILLLIGGRDGDGRRLRSG